MGKSLSIALAAFAALQSIQAKEMAMFESPINEDHNDSVILKSPTAKLVLKLNMVNPNAGHMLSMHSSHSSHRSHSSHSSHSSHYSSSYSSGSSRSYSAPASTYTTPTRSSAPTSTSVYSSFSSNKNTRKASTKTKDNTITSLYNTSYDTEQVETYAAYGLGDRELYKGCQGIDVERLQKILQVLGYDIIVSEYFGDKTEKAIIKFQKDNELRPDGRVGAKTLSAIIQKL